MTKFCPSCGAELVNKNAIACTKCGGAIKEIIPITQVNHVPPTITYRSIKNPLLAAILSLILPGLGQIYNGQNLKGIICIILAVLLLLTVFGYMFIICYAIVDAYVVAGKINRGEIL